MSANQFLSKRKIILLCVVAFIVVVYQIGKYSEKKNAENAKRIESVKKKLEDDHKNRSRFAEINGLLTSLKNPTQKPGSGSVQTELQKISGAATLIEETLIYGNKEEKELAEQSKKLLLKYQRSALPTIRKKFADDLGVRSWEDDIDVTVGGAGNTTITFVGAHFAANRNIKKFQELMHPQVHRLKFKRVNYKWIKHDDDYTYYEIKPSGDDVLIK